MNIVKLLFSPRAFWQALDDRGEEVAKLSYLYLLLMPCIAAVAWYYGTSQHGWMIGDRLIKVSADSALPLGVMFYLTLVGATIFIGVLINWMAKTYGAQSTLAKGISTAAYCATPVYLGSMAGVYPVFWFDLIVGTLAAVYSAYLLYLAIPIRMNLPEERGFLYTCAVFAACLVMAIAVLGATTICWAYFFRPIFVEVVV